MSNIDIVYNKIRKDCLNEILKNKIDIGELAFRMGCSVQNLLSILKNKTKDLSVYLKLYDILINW